MESHLSHLVDLDGTLPLKWDSLKFIFKFSTDKEAFMQIRWYRGIYLSSYILGWKVFLYYLGGCFMTKELKSKVFIPENYKSNLSLIETEIAIKKVKDFFETKLAETLNLTRVSAPLFLENGSGLNDNLNGVERPVSFDMLAIEDSNIEIVHSLAKWKRFALHRYKFEAGSGLYTDMNAIRRDEELDNIHSIYVDQWDWEKVITKKDRNIDRIIV